MALFRTPGLEVVFLHYQRCDRIGSRCSGNQLLLFSIPGIVWCRKHTLGLWRQVKQIFNHRDARRDIYFMDHQGGFPDDLTARFTISRASIWDVVCFCARYPVLPDLFIERFIPINLCLKSVIPGRISHDFNRFDENRQDFWVECFFCILYGFVRDRVDDQTSFLADVKTILYLFHCRSGEP